MPRRVKVNKERRKTITKSKPSRFHDDNMWMIDFKNPRILADFLTERGKIISRRVTGNTRHQQNLLIEAIKRARQLALLPFTITHAVRD